LDTLENHNKNIRHPNGKLTYKQQQIEWRRGQVLELSAQGFSVREIAQKLQVGHSTVDTDLLYLRQQAQDNLQRHIHEVVPSEYEKCMVGMKHNLKETLEIAQSAVDPKTKLQARAIVNECYKIIMDLCTNAGIVNDALNFVTQSQQKIATLQKLGQRLTETEEAEAKAEAAAATTDEQQTTTNGVF
jgi:IS30 family transposase